MSAAEQPSSRKIKVTVPAADVSVLAWAERQASVSDSFRALVKESIRRRGYVDVVNEPVHQEPRRGRPPRTPDDDDDAPDSDAGPAFEAADVVPASALSAAPAPVVESPAPAPAAVPASQAAPAPAPVPSSQSQSQPDPAVPASPPAPSFLGEDGQVDINALMAGAHDRNRR